MNPLVTWAVVCLSLVSLVSGTEARPLRGEVFSVRIEGYVGSAPADTPVEVSWTLTLKGDPYELHVTKLQVLTGKIAYYDIITALKPYRPALTIAGDDADLDRFATAPADEKIAVMGFLQFVGGARYLMVSGVEYLGKPTPAPTAGAEAQPE